MPRETLEGKAVRLLAEGRLCVLFVCAERIEAHVRGSESEYSTGYRPAAGGAHARRHAPGVGART